MHINTHEKTYKYSYAKIEKDHHFTWLSDVVLSFCFICFQKFTWFSYDSRIITDTIQTSDESCNLISLWPSNTDAISLNNKTEQLQGWKIAAIKQLDPCKNRRQRVSEFYPELKSQIDLFAQAIPH